MATAKKKAPAKRAAKAPGKTAAKKSPAKKKATASKKPAKGNVFRNALHDAREQIDNFFDSAKLKAKEIAAQEKIMEKKAELAAKAEVDKVRHLADQAEKWMKARLKADTKKINSLEKKLNKQLRDVERKLKAQAKAAEKKASKQGKELQKKIEAGTKRALGKAPAKTRAKVAAAKKKAAAPKAKARAKK
jgi:histone H1/5